MIPGVRSLQETICIPCERGGPWWSVVRTQPAQAPCHKRPTTRRRVRQPCPLQLAGGLHISDHHLAALIHMHMLDPDDLRAAAVHPHHL